MSQRRLSSTEIQFLEEAAEAGSVSGTIRLREGEYQFNLAKAIASFQLELMFPDVKDLIRKLYGEEKSLDLQFIRKIQTILKKMQKGNIVKILPKKNPWQLQRYALSSFKFQDSDKNLIVLANDEQIRQMQDMLGSVSTAEREGQRSLFGVLVTAILAIVAYAFLVWALIQPLINPFVFFFGMSVSVVCSLLLGKMLAER